jgi:hypothetical protein
MIHNAKKIGTIKKQKYPIPPMDAELVLPGAPTV